jgi:hypothetical protein
MIAISLAYPSGEVGPGVFTRSNDFYMPSLRLKGGGGGKKPGDVDIRFLI